MTPRLSERSFGILRKLLAREIGHRVNPETLPTVSLRLAPLAGHLGLIDVDALVARLDIRPDARLMEQVLEAVANGETSFFRDPQVFDRIRDLVLPRLLEERASTRRLDIWSAACSTGEEPYSLAMTIDRVIPPGDREVRVHATDLRTSCIERAMAGTYSQFQVQRGLPVRDLLRYFRPAGKDWSIVDSIRKQLTFQRFNLLDSFDRLPGPFDLVMLRNVIIYLDDRSREELFLKIHRVLRPGGFLILGVAESALDQQHLFELHDLKARIHRRR